MKSESHSIKQIWADGVRAGVQQVDSASAVFFRIAFGLIAAKWAWDYLTLGRVTQFYVTPKFHFTYFGFDWIQPWPGIGMYVHFWGLLLLGIAIAIGYRYRIASFLFAIGFTYVFLLDRTNYQNHYYLICLISWCLPLMPLNANFSADAYAGRVNASQTLPRWVLWALQFHVGLPYFLGGVAKFDADWLLGVPLFQMLATKESWPVMGGLLAAPGTALLLAWMGMLFDLLVVPALIWKRTRLLAYGACVAFHLMNSAVFDIHIFPWFMLLATPIFFAPEWPKKLLVKSSHLAAEILPEKASATDTKEVSQPEPEAIESSSASKTEVTWKKQFVFGLACAYCMFHFAWPLRHHFYEGNTSWNERGHYFAWRMMLRGKTVVLGYAIKDKDTGRVMDGNVNRFINSEQSEKFGRDPEMILHLAHFLGDEYQSDSGNECEVYALVLASLNGREPELLLDPNVDLLKEERGFQPRSWVMPQTEPLRREPWDLPVSQWRQHVDIPKLEFLAVPTTPKSLTNSNRNVNASFRAGTARAGTPGQLVQDRAIENPSTPPKSKSKIQ